MTNAINKRRTRTATRLCAALICTALWVSPAVAIGATKQTKETAPPYCPPGQSLVDSKVPEFAGIRNTTMAFMKLDFEWSRGGPMEWKYRK